MLLHCHTSSSNAAEILKKQQPNCGVSDISPWAGGRAAAHQLGPGALCWALRQRTASSQADKNPKHTVSILQRSQPSNPGCHHQICWRAGVCIVFFAVHSPILVSDLVFTLLWLRWCQGPYVIMRSQNI